MTHSRSIVVALLVMLAGLIACGSLRTESPPRLLVTVVVDGLSTRQMLRHRDCYGDGGFERLLGDGAWFEQARFSHTTTFTAAGHGTIATGTSPSEHGLVGNGWFDRSQARRVYCVEDEVRTVGAAKGGRGSSPRNLLMPTLADVLWMRSEGKSQSLAVSIKDRGAVTGSGRHGLAYWWDNGSGRFISSTFYRESMPDWWDQFYASRPQDRFVGLAKVDEPCSRPWHEEYSAALDTILSNGVRFYPDETLPEEVGDAYYRALKSTPHADELTFEFLQELLANSDIGRGEGRIDQLFVSFSAHDYVAHDVGPDSPTATAIVHHIDSLLERLFAELDRVAGEGRWTLAFTADHGYPETPEVERRRGRDAGRLDPRRLGKGLDASLDAEFGARDWVLQWAVPTFYLDIPESFDELSVRRFAQLWLEAQPGIHRVFRRDELLSTEGDDSLLVGARHSYQPDRSGDLLVLQDYNWYLLYNPRADVCTHGSPWDYDREVPLIFLGRGVRSGHYDDVAEIRDLVPTLLALAGEKPASTMSGKVLTGAIR